MVGVFKLVLLVLGSCSLPQAAHRTRPGEATGEFGGDAKFRDLRLQDEAQTFLLSRDLLRVSSPLRCGTCEGGKGGCCLKIGGKSLS